MSTSYRTRTHDQRIADEVNVDRTLMCPAHGCPNRWSVNGEQGRACGAHYGAPLIDWPRITQQQLDNALSLAKHGSTSTSTAPMSREQGLRMLGKLREVGKPKADPLAWARELRARHEAGARLTPQQVTAYTAVLVKAQHREASQQSQPFDLPPIAPAMPPAIELPPVDAYGPELGR